MTDTLSPNHPLSIPKSRSDIRDLWIRACSGSESFVANMDAIGSSWGWANFTFPAADLGELIVVVGPALVGEPLDLGGTSGPGRMNDCPLEQPGELTGGKRVAKTRGRRWSTLAGAEGSPTETRGGGGVLGLGATLPTEGEATNGEPEMGRFATVEARQWRYVGEAKWGWLAARWLWRCDDVEGKKREREGYKRSGKV